MYYGYIYLTTCLCNNKKYIGQHSNPSIRAYNKIDKTYLGSGKHLYRAIQKYGKTSFSVEILEWCNSRSELNDREIFWIKLYDATNSDDYYNIANGGEGHTCEPWNKGTHGLVKVTQKSLDALEYGRHLPASDKQKATVKAIMTGRVVSSETRSKLSNASKKQFEDNPWCIMYDCNHKRQHVYLKDVEDRLLDGWVKASIDIPYEIFYDLYINKNLTALQIANIYNTERGLVKNLARKYKIQKKSLS